MAEDRGAFKTNPAELSLILPFVIVGYAVAAKPQARRKSTSRQRSDVAAPIFRAGGLQPCDILKQA